MSEVIILDCTYALPVNRDLMRASVNIISCMLASFSSVLGVAGHYFFIRCPVTNLAVTWVIKKHKLYNNDYQLNPFIFALLELVPNNALTFGSSFSWVIMVSKMTKRK